MMLTEKDLYREIGRRIRAAREERMMTQEALGLAVSLTRTSITNIESGRQRISVHTLWRVAEALQVDPRNLLPEPRVAVTAIAPNNSNRVSASR